MTKKKFKDKRLCVCVCVYSSVERLGFALVRIFYVSSLLAPSVASEPSEATAVLSYLYFKWLIVPMSYQPYSFEDFLVIMMTGTSHLPWQFHQHQSRTYIACQLITTPWCNVKLLSFFICMILWVSYYSYAHPNHFRSRSIPCQWCNCRMLSWTFMSSCFLKLWETNCYSWFYWTGRLHAFSATTPQFVRIPCLLLTQQFASAIVTGVN